MTRFRPSAGAVFIVAALLALLAVSLWMAVDVWREADRAVAESGGTQGAVSGHGIAALILGGLGTIVIGGGLMALVFFSSRSGHDEAVHHDHSARAHPDDDPLR